MKSRYDPLCTSAAFMALISASEASRQNMNKINHGFIVGILHFAFKS